MKCEKCGYDDKGTGDAHVCEPAASQAMAAVAARHATAQREAFGKEAAQILVRQADEIERLTAENAELKRDFGAGWEDSDRACLIVARQKLEKMTAERDALKARVENENSIMNSAADEIARANIAIDMIIAERDAMRTDAERYRWLRAKHWSHGNDALCVTRADNIVAGGNCVSRERLDAAIDEARKT